MYIENKEWRVPVVLPGDTASGLENGHVMFRSLCSGIALRSPSGEKAPCVCWEGLRNVTVHTGPQLP